MNYKCNTYIFQNTNKNPLLSLWPAALKRFRGTDDVEMDVDEMKLEQQQLQREPKWSVVQLLKTKSLRSPLLLVCALAMCQQLSGINVVRLINKLHIVYLLYWTFINSIPPIIAS